MILTSISECCYAVKSLNHLVMCVLGDGSRFFLSRCCKRYCFKGYFWAVIAALCFFVVFPAGVMCCIIAYITLQDSRYGTSLKLQELFIQTYCFCFMFNVNGMVVATHKLVKTVRVGKPGILQYSDHNFFPGCNICIFLQWLQKNNQIITMCTWYTLDSWQ